MNKARRTAVEKIADELEALAGRIGNVHSEEEEAKDALPENMQESERAQAMDEALDVLGDAECTLDDIVQSLRGLL